MKRAACFRERSICRPCNKYAVTWSKRFVSSPLEKTVHVIFTHIGFQLGQRTIEKWTTMGKNGEPVKWIMFAQNEQTMSPAPDCNYLKQTLLCVVCWKWKEHATTYLHLLVGAIRLTCLAQMNTLPIHFFWVAWKVSDSLVSGDYTMHTVASTLKTMPKSLKKVIRLTLKIALKSIYC